jgi:hypothetical protein
VRAGADATLFQQAVAELEAAIAEQRSLRPELELEAEPPPRRLAPHSAAIAATAHEADTEVGWGTFVLLYDPAGQPGWGGQHRIIAYLRADLEPEIAADPLIGEVGWSWLTEALDAQGAAYAHASGTVTRVVTEGFGAKQDEPASTSFELRASWSPAGAPGQPPPLSSHLAGWCDALWAAAGLPPLAPGLTRVAALRPPRRGRHG